MYDVDVEVNEFYCNKNLQGKILDSNQMKKIGFRENELNWYYSKLLKDDISFDVTIYKDNPETRINIEIFDEDSGQHYDFQKYLRKDPNFKYALNIREMVEKEMSKLKEYGVVLGHNYGDYI